MALVRYVSVTLKHFLGLLIVLDVPERDSKNFAWNGLLRTHLVTVLGFIANFDIPPEISKKHFVRIEGRQFPR